MTSSVCPILFTGEYLSRLERMKLENGTLFYSEGVLAGTEAGKRIIRKGDFVLREDDHLFVPALWTKKEIIAYSRPGYENKAWQLPEDWRNVKSVDLYRITMEGCVPVRKNVPVTATKVALSLGEDEAVSIVPAGAGLSGRVAVSPDTIDPAKPDRGNEARRTGGRREKPR